jgi:TDG/mug DNA glycosylase family protein
MVKLAPFDVFAPRLAVVFCGINPSPAAAATGHNFGSASNRFWRVLHMAGYTPVQLKAEEDRRVLDYGCGITAAVTRATRRASELGRSELASANGPLLEKLEHYRPDTIAFLGKAAYAALRGSGPVTWGEQPERLGDGAVWILPNTSGLNRNFTLPQLVEAFAALRAAKSKDFARWKAARPAGWNSTQA